MAPVTCVPCRAVAPLVARYNDPDLREDERVRLSTHLLQCPACLARLQEYRALDQQVRRMSGMTLSPQVREAVLERVTAPVPAFGFLAIGAAWRQAWLGAATALSLTALMLAFGLATLHAAQGGGGTFPSTTANSELVARPMMATAILSASPTGVVSSVGASLTDSLTVDRMRFGSPQVVRATVREIRPREGRLIVRVEGTQAEESLVITRETLILRADGRQGTIADLAVGATVQLQRDQNAANGLMARQIILAR